MKKLIKLEFNNTTRERKTEDSYSELYSYDKNNGSFEFEILNDTLTTEQVIALFKFTDSNKIWKTTGTVEGNKVKVTFDTTLITQNETVICYLYFDEEQRTSDTFRFKFKVKVSEIDKMSRYEVKERFINNTVIVDRLDVVTKDELKEALKNVGGIATEGLLTEVKAEELYAKKTDVVDNTNFELVKNRVLALELKTDKDTIYDDSEVKERLTTLENKSPVDLSNYATKEELRNVSGSQPLADNLVTKEELENKHYISDVSNLATKEELQEVRNSQPTVDTSNLVTRDELTAKNYLTEHQSLDNLVTKQELEEKHYLTTHQDLSEYAKKSELYNDSDLRNRVVTLESKEDKDTKYDDTEVKRRLTELEGKPVLDTSFFITEEKLNSKGYLTQHQSLKNVVTKEELESKGYLTTHQDISNLATKEELANVVTKEELNNKHYVTEEELNNKAYITSHQDLSNYALKSELPQPYNDSSLNERVTALENKPATGDGNVDTSKFVTKEIFDKEIKDIDEGFSNIPRPYYVGYEDQETAKEYLDSIPNLFGEPIFPPYAGAILAKMNGNYPRNVQIFKGDENNEKFVDFDAAMYSLANSLPDNYNLNSVKDDINNKVILLSNKNFVEAVPKEELKAIIREVGGTGETVDTSHFITNEILESKNYLTQHQPLDNLVTKEELNSKGYLTSHQDLSEYALKSEIPQSYSDTELVKRVTALENRPTGGGTQVQDTGWIKLSDETMTAGSIVEIRRIDNTVNVRFRNEQGNHFIVNPQAENNTILTKQISTGFGSVVNNSLMILNENKSKSLGVVSTEINNGNLQITIHITNSDYSNEFGVSVYVNEFTYITDEPFPTNLH